jgi:hypothetical protein
VTTVAKIQPTPLKTRQAFRVKLPARARGAFDRLARLIDRPRADLRWHHQLGARAQELMGAAPARSRTEWWYRLARALGPCPALLQKAARFARPYPSAADLAALGRLRVDWTRASLALVIAGRKDRHKMLRKARREGWTGQRLRFEIQRQYPSRRRGAGGRPRRDPEAFGADVTLRELERLCRRWLAFHEEAWKGVRGRDWVGFVRGWPEQGLDDLLRLLGSAEEAVQGVARAGRAVRAALAGLRQRAERRQGLHSHNSVRYQYSNTIIPLPQSSCRASPRRPGGPAQE